MVIFENYKSFSYALLHLLLILTLQITPFSVILIFRYINIPQIKALKQSSLLQICEHKSSKRTVYLKLIT